jgi:hypothetical protein
MTSIILRATLLSMFCWALNACESPLEYNAKPAAGMTVETADIQVAAASVQLRNNTQTPALLKKLIGFE